MAEKNGKPEAPAARFKRLGEKRVRKAIKSIKLIGNLSGGGYASTPEQVDRIFDELTTALAKAKIRFEQRDESAPEFSL